MRGIVRAVAAWAALGSAGCMTVGLVGGPLPTAGGFAYSGGRGTQTFARPLAEVQTAAVAAMGDQGIHSVSQIIEAQQVVFDGKTADNRRALITLQSPTGRTVVAARFGLFGDEAMSRAFLDRVGIRLGTRTPEPVAAEVPSSPDSNPYFSRGAVSDATMLKGQVPAGYRDTPVP